MKRKTNKSNENEVVKKAKETGREWGKKQSRDENGKKKILKRTITDETGINQT